MISEESVKSGDRKDKFEKKLSLVSGGIYAFRQEVRSFLKSNH